MAQIAANTEKTVKLVFLGDSLTHGGYGGNWVAGVAAALPQHTIINEGIGGDTVVNLLERAETVLEAHLPDAVFVMVGGNDAVSYTMPDTRAYYRSAKKVLPDGMVDPQRFAADYRALLTLLQLRHVLTFAGLPPTEYNAALMSARREYNQIMAEIAQGLGVPTLDLAAHFMPHTPVERGPVTLAFIQEIGRRMAAGFDDFEGERQRLGYSYTFDGMHLTPAAAQRMSALVVDFLRQQGF
jgi:lysophospholipase L1-like esterase